MHVFSPRFIHFPALSVQIRAEMKNCKLAFSMRGQAPLNLSKQMAKAESFIFIYLRFPYFCRCRDEGPVLSRAVTGGKMAIDAIGQGNGADLLGVLSQGTSQEPTLQAASMSVLKIALNEADSTAAALASEISSAGSPGGQLNVYA